MLEVQPSYRTSNLKQRYSLKELEDEFLARLAAREHLIDFACYVDPPAANWYGATHLKTIAAKLESVERGDIPRLIITMPPRHWKSSLASEKFPAWYLGRNPEKAVILASYAESLAVKFSRSVRDTVTENPHFRKLFTATLAKDATRVDDWRLETGVRSSFRAVGVGGGITGHGANLIIIDDPIADYEAAQSELQRNNLWEWYRQVLRTRLEPGGCIVLIQTRWHEDDLAGKLVTAERESGGECWDTLNLPAVGSDGTALWPERFSLIELGRIRDAIGAYAWNALFQGDPVQPEGSLIKREWFEYVPQLPDGAKWQVCAFDCAWTEKQTQKDDPDYTARVKATKANNCLYLGSPRMFRKDIDGVAKEIVDFKKENPGVRVGMGKVAVKASIVKALVAAGFGIEEYEENTDKIARASAWLNWAANGRVKLVGTEEEWKPFMSIWTAFPHGAHDDPVDCVSGGAQMLGVTIEVYRKPEKPKNVWQALEA